MEDILFARRSVPTEGVHAADNDGVENSHGKPEEKYHGLPRHPGYYETEEAVDIKSEHQSELTSFAETKQGLAWKIFDMIYNMRNIIKKISFKELFILMVKA